MIKNGDLVCVGVSGGKDSLVLLDTLKKMSQSHNFKIIAVTIDEGIPGYRAVSYTHLTLPTNREV